MRGICGLDSEEAKGIQGLRFRIGGTRTFHIRAQSDLEDQLGGEREIKIVRNNAYAAHLERAADKLQEIIHSLEKGSDC